MSYLLDQVWNEQFKDCPVNIEQLQQDIECLTSGGDASYFLPFKSNTANVDVDYYAS